MPDHPYKNREIDSMFATLDEKMGEKFDSVGETLERIEAQTTKTNGRVTKLEQWKYYVMGFCGAVALLASFLT